MSERRGLYYDKSEIEVLDVPLNVRRYYTMIARHEVMGLQTMGCSLERNNGYLLLRGGASQRKSFYNRVMNISTDEENLGVLIASKEAGDASVVFVINPFTTPSNAEKVLDQCGATHTLSSVVLGRQSTENTKQQSGMFRIKEAMVGNIDDLFDLFARFFLKEGELPDDARVRLKQNLNHGPHLICYLNGVPVAFMGSVIFDNVASIYSGLVLEDQRKSPALQDLGVKMSQALKDKGVDYEYMKTRNRAVVLYAIKMFGFQRLYNERVYEI